MGKIFGTDGIRGKANVFPMTSEMALKVGKAVAHVFKSKKNGRTKIVIGKDTRLSGYMLETALASGIVAMGAKVILVGPVPTPAIAHLTKSLNCDAGIMLTASHNPAEDNGIKIFSEDGYKLSDEVEEEIEKYLLEEEIDTAHVTGEKIGKAYRLEDASGRYTAFAKAAIKSASLRGMKIVLDCANGAAYKVAPAIFEELGADVTVIGNKPNGLNINLECGATHTKKMQEKVKETNADIGIALDGDADRIIVSDEKGNIVDGDKLLLIMALDLLKSGKLANNTLVVTVYSNLGLDEAMEKAGGKTVRTACGDRYVLEEMRKSGHVLGGEKSGHIIYGNYCTTGDGIISGLLLLNIMKKEGKKISELADCMNEFPQILINLEVRGKKAVEEMPAVSAKIKEIDEKLGKKGRTLIRYSGTQNVLRIMIEGQDKEDIEKYANEIADEVRKEVGV
jgi:phosphoglucosamine mutase